MAEHKTTSYESAIGLLVNKELMTVLFETLCNP